MAEMLLESQTAGDVAQRLQRLELEESRLHRALAKVLNDKLKLRSRLHTTPPSIERLPPEILMNVFHFHVHDTSDAHDLEILLNQDLRAVALSHVCRKWRQLALLVSDLWTHLVLNNPRAADVFAQRSGSKPVDLYLVSQPSQQEAFYKDLYSILSKTLARWKNVTWLSGEDRARHLLSVLNKDASFPDLQSLVIRVKSRSSPCIPILGQRFERGRFPALSELFLSGLSPSELPPSTACSLRHLSISFPVSTPKKLAHARLPPLFQMSSFCAYLSQTTRLETLEISHCTPLMDVYLHPGSGHYSPITTSIISPIRAAQPCSSVQLPHLTRLDWTSAPPADLWRLFHFLDTPALSSLNLCLAKADQRWLATRNNDTAPMSSSHPLSQIPVDQLLHFNTLQQLRVYCSDEGGLTVALRNMHFPSLGKLELVYLGGPQYNSQSQQVFALYPALESIIREPRLVKLTHLTISGFSLVVGRVTATLAYMPELRDVLIELCKGVYKGRATDEQQDSSRDALRRWRCSKLESVTIRHCDDLTFRWLKTMLTYRLDSIRTQEQILEDRVLRPLPSGKRFTRDGQSASAPCTPKKGASGLQGLISSPLVPVASSPNGSFVAGWNPHETPQATRRLHLVVENCMRISEAELISLEDGKRGSIKVVWRTPA